MSPADKLSGISRLYAIVDAEAAARAGWSAIDVARALLEGGARWLQVRAKNLGGAALLDLAKPIVALARPHGATVIINDRADIAALADADGVHLGQDDLTPSAARGLLASPFIVGLSTHTATQLDLAAHEPVDYLAIGPVFGTRTKDTGYDAIGLSMVRAAARTGLPVVAIGGITLENAADAIEAGATSVAVIADLLATSDPATRARQYMSRLERI